MKKALLATAGLAAVVAVAWVVWPRAAAPLPDAPATGAAPESRSVEAPLAGDPAPAPQRSVVAKAEPVASPGATGVDEGTPAGTGSLRVRAVFASDGKAAAGARILIERGLSRMWSERLSAVADASGTAEWTRLPPGAVTVSVLRGGQTRATVEAGRETEVVVKVPAGIDLRGEVVDPDGVGIPGAALWLSDPWRIDRGEIVGRCDDRGRFHLRDLGTDRSLAARAPGYEPSRLHPLKARAGEERELRIVLARGGGSLAGTVVDSENRPVAGARILVGFERRKYDRQHDDGSWVPGPPPVQARSDKDGAFALTGLESGRLPLQVRAPGHGPWRGEVEISDHHRQRVQVVLVEAAAVAGIVRDAEGQPLRGARIAAGDPLSFAGALDYSAADGSFRLEDLPPGEVRLVASKAHHDKAEFEVSLLPGTEQTWEPVLAAVAGEPILRGRLVDHLGQPVPHWRVIVAEPEVGAARTRSTSTDARGAFELAVPWPQFRFWAHGPRGWSRFPPVLRDDLRADGTEQVIRIPDPSLERATLRARVVDEQGQPVAALAQLWIEELRLWREYGNDPETGELVVEGIPPGRCHIEVRPAAHGWMRLPPMDLVAGQTRNLGDLIAVAGAVVHGTLRHRTGGVLPAVMELQVLDSKGYPAAAVQRADASFRTGPLQPGRYTLVVQGERIASGRIPFRVDNAAAAPALEVVLQPAALRRVRFEPAPGMPRPPFLNVQLRDEAGTLVWRGGIGRSGPLAFAISAVPGRYTLSAYGPGEALYQAPFVVAGYEDLPDAEVLTLRRR